MQNGDKGWSRIGLAGRGQMLILYGSVLLANIYIKGHYADWLGRLRIEIIIDNKNYVPLFLYKSQEPIDLYVGPHMRVNKSRGIMQLVNVDD